MTNLSKALLVVVVALVAALAWIGRYDVSPAGPRGMMVLVHDRWTGAIKICGPGGQDCLFARPAPPARVVTFDDDLLSQKPEKDGP